MTYDFSQLNDKEFEILALDLISTIHGVHIERFKSGKDGGVDGRYFTNSDKEIVFQCKHYINSGYSALISKLKNEEAGKVKIINPHEYIFITSLPLSRNNKDEIKAIFYPYILGSDSVIGQEDLNDLLANNKNIEEKHFKLWISSTTVFNRIINNAIKGRSEFEIKRIKDSSFKYIKTKNHELAVEILKEKNILIISGEPGIGKTTLADNLCLYFASDGFEFVDIEESISEAENVYHSGEKQIFYFDDFLGSNYFEAIENKKDSHIVKFIERVRKDKKKKFVLTTRTNILNSGIVYSSSFSNSNIRNNEFMLTIEGLNELDRAKILYNHIWFSDLPEEYVDELYKDKRYREIIKHKNYNPRLIEFITDVERLNIENSSEYWGYITSTLNNPKDIWRDCFKTQNNAYVRNLVKLTIFNGGNILEEDLRSSFYRLNKIEGLRNDSHSEKDFESISRLATKSFLNRNKISKKVIYTLFNPSIADYVLSEYCNNLDVLTNLFRCLLSIKSLNQLISLEKENIISLDHALKIKNVIFDDVENINNDAAYLILLSYMFKDDGYRREKIKNILLKIIQDPVPIKEFCNFLSLLMLFDDEIKIDDFHFLLDCINNRSIDIYEIEDLASYLSYMDVDDHLILERLQEEVEIYLSNEVESFQYEIDISQHITEFGGFEGEYDYQYDSDGIKADITNVMQSAVDNFYSDIIRELDIDYDSILEQVDIDTIVGDYISSQYEGEQVNHGGINVSYDDRIDDLFERT